MREYRGWQKQIILVGSRPTGAKCTLCRNGFPIGTVDSTSGSVKIKREEEDIIVGRGKRNYASSKIMNELGFNSWLVGDIFADVIIGFGVDGITGALYEYEPDMMVNLTPLSRGCRYIY